MMSNFYHGLEKGVVRMKRRDIIIIVAIAIGIFLVTRLVIQNFVVDGPSMENNLYTGQWILVNKLTYKVGEPARGDIVVFNNPWASKGRTPVLIKRVIGLPGETVKIEDGKIYIDDKLLDESEYIDVAINGSQNRTWPLDDDDYFVLGDNRNHSSDSSENGTVPQANIIGKAWLRIWPFSAWGFAPNYEPKLAQ